MRTRLLVATGLVAAAGSVGTAVRGAEYVVPPVMPIPNAWQGKEQAMVRVLNKLDTHVEVLTLAVGQTGGYGSLRVTPRSCLVRPDGLPRDAGSLILVHDAKGTTQDFTGWMFAAEPSLGVFESPVYGVQLIGCGGADVAPMAPALPPPAPPPPSMQPNPPDGGVGPAPDGTGDGVPDAPEQPPDANGAPDAVYPDGQPLPDQATPNPPPPTQPVPGAPVPGTPVPGQPVPGQPVPDQPPPDQPDPDQAPPQLF